MDTREYPVPEYFLSAYLSPPGHTAFISMRHNHCVALWARREESIELVRYWELERLSGIKHHAVPLFDAGELRRFLGELVAEEGVDLADISTLWGTPGLDGFESFPDGLDGPTVTSFHALAHLWSGLLMDTDIFNNETIVGLAMDGGPDFDLGRGSVDYFYAGGVSECGQLTTLRSIASPAVLFKAASHTFGLEPGSLMALATASKATIDIDIDELMDIAGLLVGPAQSPPAHRLVERLTAESRLQLAQLQDGGDTRFPAEQNVASAVAKVIHEISARIAETNVVELLDESGVDPTKAFLALSGGFALNCPTNSRLMNRFGFRGMLAPPCANDGGQALGIGLFAFHHRGDFASRRFRFESPYYGRTQIDVEGALTEWSPWIDRVDEFDADTFIADLAADPVAWVDGPAEIGPRALGHRSLLGDPRHDRTRDRLNELKSRQWWRPVAPIVLAEHVGEWFVDGRRSPYMLEVFDVPEDRQALVPAIVHLDGTARVQTLDDDDRLAGAIQSFADATGVPLLCNTSLNDKGEPIVDTASQALNFCVRRGVRVAYLNGRRVLLRAASPSVAPTAPETRDRHRFAEQSESQNAAWSYWAQSNVTPEMLFAIGRAPELRALLDSPDGVRKAAVAARFAVSRHPLLADGAAGEGRDGARARTGRARSFRFDGVEFVDESPG